MTTPHKCPCCDGRGKRVPVNSLTFSGQFPSETCIACKGTGVVWEPYTGVPTVTVGPELVRCAACGEPL